MNHDAQKQYFEIAYRTGSDVWTHIPYHAIALRMLPPLAPNAFILDVGAGRGLWLSKLVDHGYRVIGVDYISEIVRKGNADIKLHNLSERARFIEGDVRDLPLADDSFDATTDIGVLQHLDPADWNRYISELKRVLKPGAMVLNVSLSKETNRFMGFTPKSSAESSFEKFGVGYYFFSNDEIKNLFERQGFMLIEQQVEFFDAKTDPGDSIALVFSVLQSRE
jgi:ubiquinone/menaquinone biosynthesis C-methylase UbiE